MHAPPARSDVTAMQLVTAGTSPRISLRPGLQPEPIGRQLMQAYQRDVAMLPGLVRIRWTLDQPDAVELYYEDAQLMALSQGVLRDTLMGARWIFRLEEGAAPLPEPPSSGRVPWYQRSQNLASAALALPGIEDLDFNHVTREVTLFAHDQQALEHLRPLVRDHFGGIAVLLAER